MEIRTTFVSGFLILGLILGGLVLGSSAQPVSEKDLIIYYSFNKDTLKAGDVLDVSGNGNDGFLHGQNLKSVAGKVAEGMAFPGRAAAYISVRNHMYVEPIAEISLVVWVKTGKRGMIASWDRNEFFRFSVGDSVGENDGKTFVAFDTCCPCCHDWFSRTDVADNEWHHIVATFDGKAKRIYIDGELDRKIEVPTDVIGAGEARFGFVGIGSEADMFDGDVGPTWAFGGIMDEFMLFHRALSADEVKHLAKGTENPFSIDPNGKLSTTWADIKDN